MLDFSRVMPPEYPQGNEDIFFKLLRPEFVAKYHLPLSSDAFSGFKGKDSQHNNEQVKTATFEMLKSIPAFARELSEMIDTEIETNWKNILLFHNKLPRIIHQAGINMRHLGILYENSTTYNCKMLLLIEIAARTIKHKLREKMRNHMKQYKHPTEHHYITLVIEYLNQVFTSTEMWYDITYSAIEYFKISPFDGISHLKEEHDNQKKISQQKQEKGKKKVSVKKLPKEDLTPRKLITRDDSDLDVLSRHLKEYLKDPYNEKTLKKKKNRKWKIGSLSPRKIHEEKEKERKKNGLNSIHSFIYIIIYIHFYFFYYFSLFLLIFNYFFINFYLFFLFYFYFIYFVSKKNRKKRIKKH